MTTLKLYLVLFNQVPYFQLMSVTNSLSECRLARLWNLAILLSVILFKFLLSLIITHPKHKKKIDFRCNPISISVLSNLRNLSSFHTKWITVYFSLKITDFIKPISLYKQINFKTISLLCNYRKKKFL